MPVLHASSASVGVPELRMGVRKGRSVVTDQEQLRRRREVRLDSRSGENQRTINNIRVLENGLFVGVAHRVLFGALENGKPVVRERVRSQ